MAPFRTMQLTMCTTIEQIFKPQIKMQDSNSRLLKSTTSCFINTTVL